MESTVKFKGIETSLRYIFVLVDLRYTSVALPAAVSLLGTHVQDKEVKAIEVCASGFINPATSLNGGQLRKAASQIYSQYKSAIDVKMRK